MKRILLALALTVANGFIIPTQVKMEGIERRKTKCEMSWQPNEDYNTFGKREVLTDFERSAREAGATDRKVTIRKPLGLVLDEKPGGDVYVKEIVKGGNADAVGGIKEGDIVAMCSATFGGDMWSTRGVGLSRVVRAIEVRSGNSVSLVVQSKAEQKKFPIRNF
mmetsp:Transcript_19955/g.24180  ORF Transcript_19955/g.24180 Transcript_19955/m.24180 type:complete len:164 (+) Transcript_19955:29-520(+)